MHDEVYMRQWNDHHHVLSRGIDQLLARLHFGRARATKPIGTTYVRPERQEPQSPSPTRTALLSGLASVLITAVIFTAGIASVTEARPQMAGPVENGSFLVELA